MDNDTNVVWQRVEIKSNAPSTHIIIPNPFPNNKVMNKYFIQLANLLEYNTNKLVIGDRRGSGVTATKEMLRSYLNVSNSNINKIVSIFVNSGIMLEIKVMYSRSYYMNPAYAYCGKYIDYTIVKMFNDKGRRALDMSNYADLINEQYNIKLKKVGMLYVNE